MKLNKAFSLSEILLTLIIIGIVSAVALPTLRKNVDSKQYDAMMGKNYLNFKSAWEAAVADNKGFMVGAYANLDEFVTSLTAHSIYGKPCVASHHCFVPTPKGTAPAGFTPAGLTDAAKIILDDGSIVGIAYDTACASTIGAFLNACGQIWIDVNGSEKPNMYGKDVYGFVLTRDTLMPADSSYVIKNTGR